MASEREVKVKFTGEGSSVQSAARDIRQVFQALMDDTDDVRTAGAKMETAYKMVAAGMRKDMASVDEAVELLKDSLGPEMAAKLDQAGVSIEKQIGEWRKLGLTLDDIKMDSDSLATGLLDLDDAARRGTGSVGDGMRKVADSSGEARQQIGQFASNAIGQLPGVSDALGPLADGLSQVTDMAFQGGVGFQQMATAGLGMGVVGLAIKGITDAQDRQAKANAAAKESIDAFTQSILDGGNAWDAFAEKLERGEEVKIKFMDGWTMDLSKVLMIAGMTVDEFYTQVARGKGDLDNFKASLEASGLSANGVAIVMQATRQEVDRYSVATERAARFTQVSSNAQVLAAESARLAAQAQAEMVGTTTTVTMGLARANDDLVGSAGRLIGKTDDLTSSLDDEVRALDAARVAAEQKLSGEMAAIDSQFGLRSAQENTTKAIQASTLVQLDGNRTTEEKVAAEQAAEQAAWNLAKAQLRLAEDQATAAGTTLSSAEKQAILRGSLDRTASVLGPDDPLRARITGLAGDINSVPTSKQTKFSTSGIGGMLGGGLSGSGVLGEIGDVKRALDGVKDKHVTVTADTSNIERALQRVIAKAGEAERAVGRVAT